MAKNITGTLKYLKSGQLVTDWGEGNFLALKFTNNDPEKIKTIKVGLDPSQSSGLVPLDEDMNGVFKITDKDTQKFVVESYSEDNNLLKRDEYGLTGLLCETKPPYIFNSDVITNGGEYDRNYFVGPKQFTVSGMTEDDEIYLEYEPVTNAPVLTISGRLGEGGIYNGAISGVNTDAQNYNVSVIVNDTVVCAFVIQGKPAEVPKLTISEASKNVEITSELQASIDVEVTGTEATVSTFDIIGENINVENVDFIDTSTSESSTTYSVTPDSAAFEGVENGTYSVTLRANMSDETTLTDTFTLTLNLDTH